MIDGWCPNNVNKMCSKNNNKVSPKIRNEGVSKKRQ